MKTVQKRIIRNWLYSGLFLVALMVIIGGITRLTHSGLSIVEWKLIGGTIPPLNDMQWQETFEKYQQFPEYQKINKELKSRHNIIRKIYRIWIQQKSFYSICINSISNSMVKNSSYSRILCSFYDCRY